MKFSGIAAALALAGAATAVAIPRDNTVSTTANAALNQLNSLLNEVEPAVSNLVGDVDGEIDLSRLQTEISSIKSQLSALQGVVPTSAKRDVISGVTGLAGNTANTVGTTAAPVVNGSFHVLILLSDRSVANRFPVDATSVVQRDVVSGTVADLTSLLSNPLSAVNQLTPLANSLCSGIESEFYFFIPSLEVTSANTVSGNVPLTQTVGELTAFTQGIATYAQLPLSLVQLPTSN